MPKPLSLQQQNEWREAISCQQSSGLSIERWCHQNQIKPHTFHYWKKKLWVLKRTSFTELTNEYECCIEIEYQDVHVRLESSSLKQCMKVLKELKC